MIPEKYTIGFKYQPLSIIHLPQIILAGHEKTYYTSFNCYTVSE
jgi:hypothetical protein